MSIALNAQGLSKSFNGIKAADGVSVSVADGEFVSLIGANGAGKTTFINMVTGYVRPDVGSITSYGREIVGLSPLQVTRLGIYRSFQIPQVFTGLTLMENLTVAINAVTAHERPMLSPRKAALNPQSRDRVEAVMERFQLGKYRDHLVSEISGGMRKLLDVGMATINSPKVLMLDEPTSGVASEEKFDFMDLVIEALSDQKAAVLFVEHDMDIVRRYADRIVVFHEGRVLADDRPDAALAQEDVRRYVTGKA